jgi:UDP-N-acetylmuramoylalanine--D-glutamate ligase
MSLIASSKVIVVVGMGVTGQAVARFLEKTNQPFLMMDSRENPPDLTEFKKQFPEISITLGKLDEAILLNASEIILSPGISVKTPEIVKAIDNGVDVIGDVELFARVNKKPVIAITGSNAKTTVTTLVGKMAEAAGMNAAIGGNIGTPILDLIDDDIELYVLELSSFQLETTSTLKATVATILNVTEDHMDRYSSLSDYHRAKQRIYFGAKTVVVNRADPLTHPPIAENVLCYSFGLDRPDRYGFGVVGTGNERKLAFEFKSLMEVSKLKLRGEHNVANSLAALALGHAAGLPMDPMLSALNDFEGIPHRCQWVATVDQVDYINDSKATNVGATLAALKGFSVEQKNIVLIAGGESKDADFLPMKKAIADHVHLVILIGRDAEIIAGVINDIVEVKFKNNMEEAVDCAKEHAKSGDIVLLSPACASFDMFKGYEERGMEFMKAVEKVAA